MRAGYETGAKTVVVFPQEDRNSIHRQRADEAISSVGRATGSARTLVDEIARVARKLGMRTVLCTPNGQVRPVVVRERSVHTDVKAAEKAEPTQPGHVAAPFAGAVSLGVAEGDTVQAGDAAATTEAMKMEAGITTNVGGTVKRLAIGAVERVHGDDLLLVIYPPP